MEWSAFREKHLQPHLIGGEFDRGEKVLRPSRFVILARLVIALAPQGDWAMLHAKRTRHSLIFAAYESLDDATTLRNAVGAVESVAHNHRHRWSSRFAFPFDRVTSADIPTFGGRLSGTVRTNLWTRKRPPIGW
jgi:hypothetical protein